MYPQSRRSIPRAFPISVCHRWPILPVHGQKKKAAVSLLKRLLLQRVFDELNAPEFIFIDRGYIVNIVQIMKVSDSIAILKNGDQLPISRSHLQEVKRQINQFWGAHI